MDAKIEQVVRSAAERGVTIAPVTFDRETKTSQDAADAVGCELGQIVKSLVFEADGRPVLLLVSGCNRVDVGKGARAAGVGKLGRADANAAREASGYPIGATPPFGLATELDIYMDEDLLAYEEVWAAAGRPDSVFPIAPSELARASGASLADLKEG